MAEFQLQNDRRRAVGKFLSTGFPTRLIVSDTIQIIHFFHDLTMINLESCLNKTMVNLETYTSMVKSEIGIIFFVFFGSTESPKD